MSGQIIGFVCILQLIHFVGISIIFPIMIKHISGPTEFEILQTLKRLWDSPFRRTSWSSPTQM